MTITTAYDLYNEKYPDCIGYVDFDNQGEALLDGIFTFEQLRFIADLVEKLAN